MRNKRAIALMYKVLFHIILVALILSLFLVAISGRTTSDEVKQQLLEKQLALFIEAAEPGMIFSVDVLNQNGKVTGVRINEEKIYVDVNNIVSLDGYPFFSAFPVSVHFADSEIESEAKYEVIVG